MVFYHNSANPNKKYYIAQTILSWDQTRTQDLEILLYSLLCSETTDVCCFLCYCYGLLRKNMRTELKAEGGHSARKIRHWALDVKWALSARHLDRAITWKAGTGRVQKCL